MFDFQWFLFNRILHLKEAGVITNLQRRYKVVEECTGSERRNPNEPVHLFQISGFVYAITVGIGVACIVLMYENIVDRSENGQ